MKKIAILFTLATVFSANVYANYTVTPLKLNITPQHKVTSLSFINNETDAKSFQVSVYKVSGEGINEKFEESSDILVSPKIFKLQASQTQMIRVAAKSVSPMQTINYKLSIKELPANRLLKGDSHEVKVISDFRVPIKVGAETAEDKDTDKDVNKNNAK